MRKVRQLFFLTLAMGAMPMTAPAQWATRRVEHDWSFAIGGNSYGLVQQVSDMGAGERRTTMICLGSRTVTTRVPVVCVAFLVLLPAGAVGLLLLKLLREGPGH